MKKNLRIPALSGAVLLSICLLSGCSGKPASTSSEAVAENTQAQETGIYTLYDKYGITTYNPADYVHLGDFSDIEVYQVKSEVTDSDVAYEKSCILDDYVEYADVKDRGIAAGDYVMISYTASIDGNVIDDLSGEDYDFVVGEGSTYEEFETGILGLKAGDTTTVKRTMEDDFYEEAYAGKEVTFEITITSDQIITYEPQWNDDFVKSISDEYSTVDEYTEYVRSYLIEQADQNNREQMLYDLWNEVTMVCSTNGYPDELYNTVKDTVTSQVEEEATSYGLSTEEYLEYFAGCSMEDYITSSIYDALVSQAIIEAENLKLTDTEYYQYAKDSLTDLECKSIDELEDTYGQKELYDYFQHEKLYDYLESIAKITKVTSDEYYDLYYGEEESSEDGDLSDIDIDAIENDNAVTLD